jgi:hypothetical protein
MPMRTMQKFDQFNLGAILSRDEQKSIVGGVRDTTYTCSASCKDGTEKSCTISGSGTSCNSDRFVMNGYVSYRVKCTNADGSFQFNEGLNCGYETQAS